MVGVASSGRTMGHGRAAFTCGSWCLRSGVCEGPRHDSPSASERLGGSCTRLWALPCWPCLGVEAAPLDLISVGGRRTCPFSPNVYAFNFSCMKGHSLLAPRAKQGHSRPLVALLPRSYSLHGAEVPEQSGMVGPWMWATSAVKVGQLQSLPNLVPATMFTPREPETWVLARPMWPTPIPMAHGPTISAHHGPCRSARAPRTRSTPSRPPHTATPLYTKKHFCKKSGQPPCVIAHCNVYPLSHTNDNLRYIR